MLYSNGDRYTGESYLGSVRPVIVLGVQMRTCSDTNLP